MTHKQNLHVHSSYSDGLDRPEETLLTAIERGFDSIGFSEHSHNRHSTWPGQMTKERTALYVQEIRALAEKYRGRIEVFCGLEYELVADYPTEALDYLIGSVHYLDCGGTVKTFDSNLERTLEFVNTYFDGDGLRFAKCYFETLSHLADKGPIDVIGHFDLVSKNAEKGRFLDTTSRPYLEAGLSAIHALRGKIPFFEVNTGAIARGYRSVPYPQKEFLQEFLRCGFGAVITSDCHDRRYLDCAYEDARALLLETGFKTHWVLGAEGFREYAL